MPHQHHHQLGRHRLQQPQHISINTFSLHLHEQGSFQLSTAAPAIFLKEAYPISPSLLQVKLFQFSPKCIRASILLPSRWSRGTYTPAHPHHPALPLLQSRGNQNMETLCVKTESDMRVSGSKQQSAQ
ncbi:hypothetical protein [Ktedonobacter sp. SOSP1-52]|uniref:hypothetical protein n=1 Tax=Ktedonobacter sp. SOSP1-52 TaxID=2778366 RepID=UPI0019155AA3|nr:hypothetical protein [Ktedonobacter sp. SOSP1-52]